MLRPPKLTSPLSNPPTCGSGQSSVKFDQCPLLAKLPSSMKARSPSPGVNLLSYLWTGKMARTPRS
jgi:hypothetical protein